VILPLVLMAYGCKNSGYVKVIEEFAGRKFVNDRGFWKWLCQKRRVLGYNSTNCFGLFERIFDYQMKENEEM